MPAMIDQLLTITPDARSKIDGVRTFNDFPDAVLRVRVAAREGGAHSGTRSRSRTHATAPTATSRWRPMG